MVDTTRDASSLGSFAGFGEGAPLDVPDLDAPSIRAGLLAQITDGSFDAWADTAARVGYCARPVRLVGSSNTVDTATGEVVSTFSSDEAPLGVLYRRCGNRRAHVCPSCSRLYARDTFEMIRAGVQGGKQVTDAVADNPLLFVTLTAPSFGLVHGTRPGGAPCRPRRRDDRTRCPHGRPTWCHTRHHATDADRDNAAAIGSPLCADCYDYATHTVWQWWAPELWRRFTIDVRRHLATRLGVADRQLGKFASVQYAKVAEYQARGVIHFHALIRLDGPAEHGTGSPAPDSVTAADLAGIIDQAARRVSYTSPSTTRDDAGRVLRFGAQVDVRTVRAGARTDDPSGPLNAGQVAGYLAKYATKDATGAAGTEQRGTPHLRRVKTTCRMLGAAAKRDSAEHAADGDSPYRLLGKWAHMLGFRGHFSTKSRRYSLTLGALRRARTRWQIIAADSRRTGKPIDTADLEARLLADEDTDATTLVVGSWGYAGTGWDTPADTALAISAANRAREYDQWKAGDRK